MVSVIYPYESLPGPHFSSSGIKQQSNFLINKAESGYSRIRKRFKSVPAEMKIQWRLTSSQADFFLGWVEHVLDGGVLSFSLNMRSPQGVVPHEFRFLTHPLEGVKPSGNRWLYSAKMEVRELPVMSEEDVADELFKPLSSEEFVDKSEQVINGYGDL